GSMIPRLDRLLSDLLDLDRLSRGIIEPKRRPVDLGGLVRGVVRDFRTSFGRQVVSDIAPVVADVDRAQIERIVENLLTNAARHTPEDTPIWVTVEESPEGPAIVVEDAGPGIPENLRRDIFEPFRQGPSIRAHSPGVGIGLALVRRFVDLHGGTVEVSERRGGGSSFRIVLPRAQTGRAPRPTLTVETPAASPRSHAG
ncbi:MAG TPA: ATP-binding protein, partial [Actinomycetota bacterium]|nr:ATP-binding protein [Actinomycetota bacterium]